MKISVDAPNMQMQKTVEKLMDTRRRSSWHLHILSLEIVVKQSFSHSSEGGGGPHISSEVTHQSLRQTNASKAFLKDSHSASTFTTTFLMNIFPIFSHLNNCQEFHCGTQIVGCFVVRRKLIICHFECFSAALQYVFPANGMAG